MAANHKDSSGPPVSKSLKFLAWLTVTVALTAVCPGNAWAWGRIGHRVAAKMAEEHLTPRARDGINALLGNGIKLADIATWADEQQEISGTALWHSVNVPVRESRYDSRYCMTGGCVVSKIEEFKRVLMSSSAGRAEKQRALKFLVHFVADLHQPLHVGDNNDRGGNLLQVRFFGEGSNLHRVWDYQIMERHTENEQVWVWDLTFQANPKRVAEWSAGSPEEWATESLILAKSARRLPGSQSWIKPGASITPEYCSAALPVIQRQLAKAGIRTAWMLNQIFQ
jgi:nuclease S1